MPEKRTIKELQKNCESDFINTPISVLKYLTELEMIVIESENKSDVKADVKATETKHSSGIFDKLGTEVNTGDTLIFPYITPFGTLEPDTDDFKATVVFEHGCYGYYNELRFVPLVEWQETDKGDYVPNAGNKTNYLGKYLFTVQKH